MRRSPFLVGLLLILGWADASYSQAPVAREQMRLGLEAAALGDTALALRRLDQAVRLDPALAEAHFHLGQIYSEQASSRATDFRERLLAQQSLEAALRHDPDNPMYLLAYGQLKLKQQARIDAQRMFQRALDSSSRADAAVQAEVHYQLGVMHETQWLRFRNRHQLPIHVAQLNAQRALDDPTYVWQLLDRSMYPGDDQGFLDREAMLDHYRAALALYPAHVGAAMQLLAYLYDERQMDEYLAVARQFVRAASGEPRGYLALGLGLHIELKPEEAAGAFLHALSLMNPRDRAAFENISRILSRDLERQYIQLGGDDRTEFERRFWGQSDPLFLTPANEAWAEYMARMTYVDMRFGLPEYGTRGWETDRGLVWLRYGEPLRQASYSPSTTNRGDFEAIGRITTVWAYGDHGPVFLFRQNPGYRQATFGNDFLAYTENYREIQPASMVAPSIPARYPVAIQATRFRGPDGTLELELHALLPMDSLAARSAVTNGELEVGLFVQDEGAHEVQRKTRMEPVDFRAGVESRLESWSALLEGGKSFLIGVEARDPLTWHAATGRVTVAPKAFPAGELSVSDLLLADRVEPLVADAERRADFMISPNPAMTYGSQDPIAIYFEIYNLLPDPEHYASYEIELVMTVEEIQRDGPALRRLLGDLADRWGFTLQGTDAVQLRFARSERVLARDMVPEYFQLQLPGAPNGRYGLQVTIRDRNANATVVAQRQLRIEGVDTSR